MNGKNNLLFMQFCLALRRPGDVLFLWRHLPAGFTDMLRQQCQCWFWEIYDSERSYTGLNKASRSSRSSLRGRQWKKLKASNDNHVHKLVSLTEVASALGDRSRFTVIYDPDSGLKYYNAMLSAKGFSQTKGVQKKIFSPTVRMIESCAPQSSLREK